MKKLILVMMSCSVFGCSMIRTKNRDEPVTKRKNTMFKARSGNIMRKRIMVLPFINNSAYPSKTIAEDARAIFISELKRTDEVLLVDWKVLGVSDIASFRKGSSYDFSAISKRVRNSGVHAIIIGRITDLKTGKKGDSVGVFRRIEAQVNAKAELTAISVRSAKVMLEESGRSDVSERMTRVAERAYTDDVIRDDPAMVRNVVFNAFDKTIPPLIDALQKFSWEGRIALVRGESVYLNAGRLSGLQIGDLLRIVEDEKEIFDPQTDRFIGHAKGRMKGTLEVQSYYGKDGALTRVHSGSGFKENDLVEFY